LSQNWLDWLSATVKAIDARIDPRTERSVARKHGAVAVIPVFGIIMPRPSIYEYYGLATSTQTISRRVGEALADADVKAIVLDVDSPGGVISGVGELAGELRGLRGGAKPIVAHADYLVASAAYWIASQADEIIATPSALVGSVGVYSMHVDQSAWLEQLGIKITFVAEPAQKVEGNPFAPLGAEAEAHMRGIVAQGLKAFRADVAAGRGIAASAVADEWARVYTAADARAMGMVDKIRTLPETLAAYGVNQARDPAAARQRAQELRQAELQALEADLRSMGVRA
jgi:signal peptide peptidase SppA